MTTTVIFETATIADAVKKAERVAPSKGHAFDKAAGLVFEIDPVAGTVVLRATDTDVFYMEWLDTVSMEGPSVIWRVPSRLLAGVTGSLPIGSGKTTKFQQKGSELHVTSGKIRSKMYLMDHSYYPTWHAFDPSSLFPAPDMGGKIGQVEWCAMNSPEPPLNGVFFNGKFAAATNRYTFAKIDFPIDNMPGAVTIPSGILTPLLKQTGEVMIGVEGSQLLIMPDEYTQIRTVIFAQEYPERTLVGLMGRQYENQVKVNKEAALEMMQRAMNFVGADRFPTLQVFIGQEEFAVMLSNSEIGHIGDVMDLAGQAVHPRIELMFTPKNIMDAISNSPNSEVVLSYVLDKPAGSVVHVDGGSGYEAWVISRRQIGEQS